MTVVGLISHAVMCCNIQNSFKHLYQLEKEPPSPALCESFIMRSVKTEAVSAVVPGVGNSVTKKLLEKLCLAQCQIAPLCFNK